MGYSRLTSKILMEMEELITRSTKDKITSRFKELHKSILRKHYNAADVAIDYNRHRIKMDIVLNDNDYNPATINTTISTVPSNMFYENLEKFLKSCLTKDAKSLAFYTTLIREYTNTNVALLAL